MVICAPDAVRYACAALALVAAAGCRHGSLASKDNQPAPTAATGSESAAKGGAQPQPATGTAVSPSVAATTPAKAQDWSQLPDDVTRSTHEAVLHGGDRLIAARDDGLWEVTWWGKPLRQLGRGRGLGVMAQDEHTLIWLSREEGKQRFALHRVRLADGSDTVVAQFGAPACEGSAPPESEPELLAADPTGTCIGWVTRPNNPIEQQSDIRVLVSPAGGIQTKAWCVTADDTERPEPICGDDAETLMRQELPDLATASTPVEDARFPFEAVHEGDAEQVLDTRIVQGPAGKEVALLHDSESGFEQGQLSPSGRWRLLIGHRTEGDYVHFQVLMLDRKTGQIAPIREGPWKPLTHKQLRHYPPKDLGDTADAGVQAWMAHSDVLIDGHYLVFVPGVGGFHPGHLP